MKLLGSLLFVLAVLALSILPELREQAVRRDIMRQAERAETDVPTSVDQQHEQSGQVRHTRSQWKFSTLELQRQIRQMPQRKRHYFYTWSNETGDELTGSASGVDRNTWFVNSFLVGFKPFDVDSVWQPLATLALRKGYILDHDLYGPTLAEIWQNSRQGFLYSRGDCEDHAIILADWLIALGYEARVVLGKYRNGGHAWVVLFYNGKEYILESTSKRRPSSIRDFELAALAPEYRPMYQFNRTEFWVNTGSAYTTRYRDQKWQRRSTFIRQHSG